MNPSILDRLRAPFALAGALALLLAGAFALVAGEFSVPSRMALAAAVLAFGIYVAIDPDKALKSVTGRQWVYGSNTTILSASFIGILILVNVMGARFHQRWDLTALQNFSMSDGTIKVLQTLPEPVHAKAFFSGGVSDKRKTEDLLKEYEARSDGKLTYEMIDTFQQPALAQLAQVNVDGTVIFSMGTRTQSTITTDEAHLTTALIKLVNPTSLKAYYLTGHGERDIDQSEGDEGYSDLKSAIQADNYVVEKINLSAQGDVPSDAAALIIAAPKSPLLPDELGAINRYIDGRKGKLVLMTEPFANSNLNDLIQPRWGLTIGTGIAVDPDSSLRNDPTVVIVQQYGITSISKDLGTFSVFPFSTAILLPDLIRKGVDFNGLAMTANTRSWLNSSREILQAGPDDKKGPLVLATAIEEISNPEVEADQPIPGFQSSLRQVKNRIVIFGSAEFVNNALIKQPLGNKDLFLNSLNWVTETDQLITTRPRLPEQRPLFLTPVQSNFVFFSGALFLPIILLGIGGLIFWSRR
jgi:ABC-type uncharacterized transport system involved in gliding motility auxiliary subunit